MTTILRDSDADPGALDGQAVGVVGYGNQGRSWALNLRDSGLDPAVFVRGDETRDQAIAEGFEAGDLEDAGKADVLCLLVPDDIIPALPITPKPDALVIVASGYTLAFERFEPDCDIGMVAPRMIGPEVRTTYEEGVGFISAVGVEQDRTGTARVRTLAIARAIGGLRQGGIEMSAWQEAILDLAVEQVLSPALRRVNLGFTQVMAEQGIPIEAILCELFLSGEVERTFKRLRLEGYAGQLQHHSPVSRYGQLTRAAEFDEVDVLTDMRRLVADIADGSFADEWDAERDAGHPTLAKLEAEVTSGEFEQWEAEIRSRLGETSVPGHTAAT
jgi:ketol-acid reductoisomerase